MSLLSRTTTPAVDDNEQCPHCGRFFREGWPMRWHIKATHGPDSERLHKVFVANGKKSIGGPDEATQASAKEV